jgi:hypothetical protein
LGEAPALPFLPFFPPSIALALTRGRQLDRHLAFEGRASIARTGGGDALSSSSSFDGQRFALASGLRFAFDTLFSRVAATHLGYAHHRARWTTVDDANCPADLCSSEVERGHSVEDALVGDADLGFRLQGSDSRLVLTVTVGLSLSLVTRDDLDGQIDWSVPLAPRAMNAALALGGRW